MSLFSELQRRNVFRVATAYVVVGWLLTEVSTTLLPTFGAPDWVPRVIIFIFALGFFPVVIFAWVYELTPDGIRKEKHVERSASITHDTGRKLNIITLVTVILAVAFTAYTRIGTEKPTGAVPQVPAGDVAAASIAVLPFVNMSGSAENEYFSDGLTETLLHMLAQIPELKVAARTSSFAFKGENRNISEIADELKVAHVLEGSVQRAGDRVRITAQLIRAADGYHVWSENFDRTLTDIFVVQDEIASRVGKELSTSLLGAGDGTPVERIATSNLDAYDLYLQALAARADQSHGGLVAAEQYLQNALRLDPAFYESKVALAEVYLYQGDTDRIPMEDALRRAGALVQQVLAEHPRDVPSRSIQTYIEGLRLQQAADFAGLRTKMSELRTLADASPNLLLIRILLADLLIDTSELDEAAGTIESALQIDPLNAELFSNLGDVYVSLKRYEDAREATEKALAIDPNLPNAWGALGLIAARNGDGVGYLANFLKAIEVDPLDPELPAFVAKFLYDLGLPAEAGNYYQRVQATAPTSPIAYQLAMDKALTEGDGDELRAAAIRVLADGVPNRREVQDIAMTRLYEIGIDAGNVQEMLDIVAQYQPDIRNFDEPPTSGDGAGARFNALRAWYVVLPREEVRRRAEALHASGKSQGFPMETFTGWMMTYHAIRGETGLAVERALAEYFTQSVLTAGRWRQFLAAPYFEEFRADPRVEAAVAHWEQEEAAAREQVRRFLADRNG